MMNQYTFLLSYTEAGVTQIASIVVYAVDEKAANGLAMHYISADPNRGYLAYTLLSVKQAGA